MVQTAGVTLDAQGYFSRDGRRVVPVGVNYWPGSCGVEMWRQWPAEEMQHDLDVIKRLGLNSIRFFLRWPDFEPELGRYDRSMFDRLAQFLSWCAQRELLIHPSLFVGFMSGGFFWPQGKGERNLYADPVMVERCAAFAREAAAVLAPFHRHLLAIDLGNEIDVPKDSWNAPPHAIVSWCKAVTGAIRSAYPQSLIVAGNDSGPIFNDCGWRMGQQPGTDFYSVHTYPVSAWNPVGFDGMTDPLCQSLLPFFTKIARAFGPVMVQEFGTILTAGAAQQEAYLRGILPACWESGANGFLWWCLRDITSRVQPYIRCGFEGTLGLVDAHDQVKSGLEYYLEFARSLAERPAPAASSDNIGLYWPKHYYLRDNPENPGNNPNPLCRRMVMANYLLRSLRREVRIVRGDQGIDPSVKTLVLTGVALGTDEVAALETWVRGAGRLVLHGPVWNNWGDAYARLLGARPVDFRAGRPVNVECFGQRWTLSHFPENMRLEITPDAASVLARDEQQLPTVLTNRVGQGTVTWTTAQVDESIASVATDRAARDRWMQWYGGLLGV